MNAVDWGQSKRAFSSSIFSLMERVEYRRITSQEDFSEIEKLREVSYGSRVFIDPEKFGSLIDPDDFNNHSSVIGVYIDEELVSTIRLHVVTPDDRHGPSLAYFPAEAGALLDDGATYIDPSRFASNPQKTWQFPAIPFLTLRVVAMASEYFKARHVLNCVREDNASFYRRSFRSQLYAQARVPDGFKVPLVLMGARASDVRDSLAERFPFFLSQPYEQRMMFAPLSELSYPPLTILPSARFANAEPQFAANRQ